MTGTKKKKKPQPDLTYLGWIGRFSPVSDENTHMVKDKEMINLTLNDS